MIGGGVRAFLRRGKFVPEHSELEAFLTGRITRREGMAHVREAVRPFTRTARQLRAETLHGLQAWDLVYIDRLAAGRLVPGEQTAAAEPLQGLGSNEALLVQHAKSRRLVGRLPTLVQRRLQALLKKVAGIWENDAEEYGRLYEAKPPRPRAKATRQRPAAAKVKAKAKAKKTKARKTTTRRAATRKAGASATTKGAPGAAARRPRKRAATPARKPAARARKAAPARGRR